MAFLVAFLIAILASAGQVLLKFGATKHAAREAALSGLSGLGALMTQPAIVAGLALYAVCAVGWLWVLSKLQVSDAYPVLSLTFVFVPLIAKFALDERLTPTHWIGALLICVGVIVLLCGGNMFGTSEVR